MGTIDEFKGHFRRAVNAVFIATGRVKFRMAAERNEFHYGAEAFEAYQQTAKAETAVLSEVKVQEVKGKRR